MKTGQIAGLVVIVAIIALALGATLGYLIASGSSPVTVTEEVMISHVGQNLLIVCGTSSFPGPAVNIVDKTTTEYLFPQSINNTAGGKFLKVTITTTTSSESVVDAISNYFTSTYTVTSMKNNTTSCPTFI
jgi:hypothetical protein